MVDAVTGVLLAGGKSRRMGQDKRFVSVGSGTLLELGLRTLQSLFKAVVIVIAQDSEPLQADVPVLRDLLPNTGSLGGLYTGLNQAATEHVFAVACDMPLLIPATIEYMAALRFDMDVVMAQRPTGFQPMHAFYGKRCLPVMEEMLAKRELKIQQLASHPALRTRIVTADELNGIDPEGRSFVNVNTPADLEVAKEWLRRSAKGEVSA